MKKPPFSTAVAILTWFIVLSSMSVAGQPPRKAFGKGRPFVLAELPAGKLKTKLQGLNPEARDKAMKWLHTFDFDSADAAQHLRVDNGGGIYMVCPDGHGNHEGHVAKVKGSSPTVASGSTADPVKTSVTPVVAKAAVSISAPPVYSSKPSATKHIYLDFNGGTVSGTQWNTASGTATYTVKVWSQDGDLTTFNDAEQAWMKEVWQRVAEDYAPFDVNVTTDVAFDPDTYTGNKDDVGWILVCETTDANNVALPHSGSGGVAYVGVFGGGSFSPTYQPAWVDSSNGGGSASVVAEAASHEMGHNMGLSHDGTSTQGYYGGHGSGDTSWGPIMGTGYNRNVSQWSKGEYYDANQTQDDLAIISSKVAYRTDDHSNTVSGATLLDITNGTAIVSTTPETDPTNSSPLNKGIISTTTDVDVFTFQTGAGAIVLNVNPWRQASGYYGGNLDVAIELRDSGGAVVASDNSATLTGASISATVAAGTYYLFVSNSGTGTPTVASPTGYTSYGSLGQYFITGTIVEAVPTLRISSVTPSTAEANTAAVVVDLTGTLFQSGATILLKKAATPDIVGTSVQFTSATAMRCTFNLTGAGVGAWDVVVTNPDTTTATLAGAFTVTPPITTLLSENFDAASTLPTNWSTSGSNAWTISTTSSQTPTRSAFIANPAVVATSYLDSAAVAIPASATDLQLSFWHSYDLESGFDGAQVQLSLDGGAWFGVNDSGSGASFGTNAYNDTVASGYQNPIAGQAAWSGSSGGFVQTTIDLTDTAKYAGKSLKVRWLIASDNAVSAPGWYVDTVKLVGAIPGASLTVTPAGGLVSTGIAGGSFSPSSQVYTITNSGTSSLNWTAAKTAAWVTLSSTGGTLAAGANTTVTVSINGSASSLAAGTFSDTVTFVNTTNGNGNTTRGVSLTVAPGDTTPPTLAPANIVDNKSGAPILVNTLVTYTVSFSEDMNASTVSAASFGNAGTAAVTIGTVTETTPGVFTVQATPTTGGTLILKVNAAAVLKDVAGNSLNTTSAIVDNTTITVDNTAPTLASIVDNKGGAPVVPGVLVTYTVSFSEDMNASTVNAACFGNAGSSTVTIGTVSESAAGVFTVPVTPTSAGTLILKVNAGAVLKDVAGNSLNTATAITDNATITVDNTVPTLAGSNMVDDKGGAPVMVRALVTYTVSFSEDMNASTVTAACFGNAGTSNVTIGTVTETSPGVFTVPVTPTTAGTLILKVDAGAVLKDVAGKNLDTSTAIVDNTTIMVDNTVPSLGGANIVDNKGGVPIMVNTLVTYTVRFSEDMSGPSVSPADFGNAGTAAVTIGAVSEVSPGVFSVRATPTTAGTLILKVNAAAILKDVAGNKVDTSTAIMDNTTIKVDGTAPTLAGTNIVDNKGGAPVLINTLVTYTVRFSEDMNGASVSPADFGNAGTSAVTIGAVTETTPGVFTVRATPTTAGTLRLKVKATAILKDVAGNRLNTTAAIIDDTTIKVDNSAPTLARASIVDNKGGAPVMPNTLVTYTVSFSEDMNGPSVSPADFGNAGTSAVTIGAVSEVSPGVFTVRATPTTAGTLILKVNAAAVLKDVAGNRLNTTMAIVDNTTIQVDNTAPTLARASIVDNKGGAPVMLNTLVTYTVSFSEDMNAASVTPADFGNAGTAAVSIGTVSEIRPGVFTVRATPTSAGTLILKVNATALLKDVAGNRLNTTSGILDNTTIKVDNTAPTLARASIVDNKGGAPVMPNTLVTYTVSFSEDMNAASVTPADFGNAGTAAVRIGTVSEISPGVFTVLATPTSAGTLILKVNVSAVLKDVAGNSLMTTTAILDNTTIKVDNTAPTLARASIVDNKGGARITPNTLVTYTVTFSEDMNGPSVTPADFGNAGTSAVTIGTVTETSPGVFTVRATPTTSGTLILKVKAAAVIKDVAGNRLNTTLAILDNTTITVGAALSPLASPSLAASSTVQSAYAAWSGGAAFDADTNNDGVSNGTAWLLGAADPSASAAGLLPTFDAVSDATYFIYTYRRSDLASADANATISVEYTTSAGWTTAVHDGTNIVITPTDDFYGPGVDKVEVKIKRTLATGGAFFCRVNLTYAP